jgi:hypothetical protein
MLFFVFFIEGEGDSEPDDARPSSFRKAGSESSATDSKIIKVMTDWNPAFSVWIIMS